MGEGKRENQRTKGIDGTEKVSRLYKAQTGRSGNISCRQRRGGLANLLDPHIACPLRESTLAPR